MSVSSRYTEDILFVMKLLQTSFACSQVRKHSGHIIYVLYSIISFFFFFLSEFYIVCLIIYILSSCFKVSHPQKVFLKYLTTQKSKKLSQYTHSLHFFLPHLPDIQHRSEISPSVISYLTQNAIRCHIHSSQNKRKLSGC